MKHIGAEPYVPAAKTLLFKLLCRPLANLKVYLSDVRDLWPMLAKGCLYHIYVLFPDPWPKARHHRRRIINQEHLLLFSELLNPKDGRLYFATDHLEYAEQVADMISQTPLSLLNYKSQTKPWPKFTPSYFYQRAQAQNSPCYFFTIGLEKQPKY